MSIDSKRLDIICFGALNLDRLFLVDRIAGAGEESVILDVKEFPGGSAANTAVGLARLGLKVGYIGKVAEDPEGRLLLNSLRVEGVDTAGVIRSRGGRSGVVMGYIDKSGERALYVNPGVNDLIEFSEVNLEYASKAGLIHLTSFNGEKPLEAQKNMVKALPDVKVTLDPGDIYAHKGLRALKPIIERCYAFLPNEEELRLLTGEDYLEGSRIILEEGVRIVAVKLGERGCYITDGVESHLIKPFRVDVTDTTGAGDAFNAGFLYGLVRGKPLEKCGLLGNFVASRCIMRVGARDGLPRIGELPPNLREDC